MYIIVDGRIKKMWNRVDNLISSPRFLMSLKTYRRDHLPLFTWNESLLPRTFIFILGKCKQHPPSSLIHWKKDIAFHAVNQIVWLESYVFYVDEKREKNMKHFSQIFSKTIVLVVWENAKTTCFKRTRFILAGDRYFLPAQSKSLMQKGYDTQEG